MKLLGKKTAYKAYSLTFTVVIIAIVIVLNVLAGIAEERFSLKLDMTSGNIFELTEETKTFLSGMKEHFTITVLSDEVTYSEGLRTGVINEILLRYKSSAGGKINLQYVDTYINPNFLAKYKDGTIEENGLIIEGSRGYRIITMSELFGTEAVGMIGNQVVECRAEQVITPILMKLSAETQAKVYLIEGHGETYYEGMTKLIESGSYELSRLSLLRQEIPEDADLVVISSPKVDFSPQELKRLDDYLRKFGNMIMQYGAESPDLPNLDRYLEEWGVQFEKNIIIDPVRYVGNVVQVSPFLNDLEINENSRRFQDRFLITPGARAINILWDALNKREVEPVLVTSNMAYAKSYDNESGKISSINQEEGDKNGPLNVGVLVNNFDMVDKEIQIGRVLFLSAPEMLSDSLLNTSNLLNSHYFMDILSYMTGEAQNYVSIPSRSMKDNVLNTVGIGNAVLFGTVVILPSFVILLLGILRWRSRRKL